ncbi:MAG: GumC family protein [Planctomycetota bacterium]
MTPLHRQGPLCVGVLALGVLVTALVILFAPRRYHSEAKLLIKLGRENTSIDPTAASSGQLADLIRTSESEMVTTLQMMQSRGVFANVVDEIGAKPILDGWLPGATDDRPQGWISSAKSAVGQWLAGIDPISDRERAMITLQEGLKVEASKSSSVVAISFRSKSPQLAQAVTAAWVEAYRREHATMNSIAGSYDFLSTEYSELQDELRLARDRFRNRKTEFGVVSIEGRRETLDTEMRWAYNSLIQNRAKLAGVDARLTSLRSRLYETPESIVLDETKRDTNETLSAMRDRLYELEIEERRLAATYSESHPKYRAVVHQLDDARQVVETQPSESSQVKTGVNPIHAGLMEQINLAEAERKGFESESESIQSIIHDLTEQSAAFNEREAELLTLQKQVEVLEAEFLLHHERREQAHLSRKLQDSEVSNVNVIQPASFQERPVSPNKKLCALLGLVASVSSALGLAISRESKHLQTNPVGLIEDARRKETVVEQTDDLHLAHQASDDSPGNEPDVDQPTGVVSPMLPR